MVECEYLYAVTEKNVDGCGGDAMEYVGFPRELMERERDAFRKCLEQAKRNAAGKDLDTADMVADAVDMFGMSGYPEGELRQSPFSGSFEF